MVRSIVDVCGFLMFFLGGIVLLFFPNYIKNMGIKYRQKHELKFDPGKEWVKSQYYITSLRLMGFVLLLAIILVCYAAIKYGWKIIG
ncbi:MAG: hypothetical protein ACHQQQ_12445 [Bacteroidota bacterium]